MMMPSGLRPYPVSFWLPRILLSIMVCGILAVGIVLFTLTVLSDNRWIKQSIISMLEGLAGGPLQIETLQVDLFPSPEIHLAGLSFETHDPGFIVLRVNRLEVGIDWQSLWDRKLFINHAVIDQPELTLQIPLGTESEEQSALPFQTIRELAIYNGQLHLFHVSGKELLSNLDWADIDLTLTELPSEGSSKIQLSAVLPNLQPPSTLALKGTLTFLEDQEEPPPPQHAHSGFQALEVHGQVEISRFPLGQLIQFVRHHELEAPLQTKGSIQGTFSYTLKHDYDLFTIQNVLFSLNEWTFAGHGSISNIFFESPRLEISGTTQPIAIRKVPVLLPDDWFPEPFLAFLDEHHVAGTMELLEGTLSGPLDGNGSWDVNGALGLKGGQFLPAPGQPLITNVAGIVTYGSSAIQISQAQGTIAPFTITTPEATLVLGEETIRLSIPTFRISEKDWNLNGTAMFTRTQNNPPMLTVSGSALPISIQRLANLIPETWRPGFVHTVLTERDIDGAMQLLTGSVKWIGDTTNTVNADGVVRLANGQVQVDPHHPQMTDISGSVAFGSNLVRVFNAKAQMASSKLLVKEATLEWKDADILLDLQGKGVFPAHDVHQALLRDPRSRSLAEPLSFYHDIQGNLYVSTQITGPVTRPSQLHILDGDLMFDDVHLSSSADGLSLNQFTGHLSIDKERMRIHRFSGRLGESPIAITGRWSTRTASNAINLSMESTWYSTDILTLFPSMTHLFSTFEGLIGTTATFSGSNLHPDFQAEFDFTNVNLESKGLFHKPSGIPGTLRVRGQLQKNKTIRLSDGEVALPPYKLEAQGQLSWSDPPYIRGILQTESGSGAIFPPGVGIGDKNLDLSSLAITWGFEGRDWDWSNWIMEGNVEATNRTQQFSSSKPNEETQSILLHWSQKNKAGKGELTVQDIPIESLLGPQFDKRAPLTGTASLITSLEMNLGSPELILRSLTGKGRAELRQGLVQTGPILSKIMGILNVPSLLMGKVNLLEEGLPYDQWEGSFMMENGLLKSQDMALKSPVLKFTAAGSYDLPRENLNAMIAVSPFGAYSNLLKDIPLFGSLMQGERKGLMTALFEVKGPRTEPDITYLPLESFTGGLKGSAQFAVDVLKNIITLPIPDDKGSPNTDRPSN